MIDLLIGYLIIMGIIWFAATLFTLCSLAMWDADRDRSDAHDVKMFAKLFPLGLIWPFAMMFGLYRLVIWAYKTSKEFIHDEGV